MSGAPKPAGSIEVFISYSHRDEELRNELINHLYPLMRQSIITAWYDRKIAPGNEWAREIDQHLETAQIILLLISANFVASDFCHSIEMLQALKRHEAGEAQVIPIILRPVYWQGLPFGKLQALPKDAKAVTLWPNHDEAFEDVARGVRIAVEKLVEAREQKLAALYQQGLQHMRDEEWFQALQQFEEIQRLAPGYRHTAERLAEVQPKLVEKKSVLYQQGLRHMQAEEWALARQHFEEILQIDPNYRDAAERLERAEHELNLATQLELAKRNRAALRQAQFERWTTAIRRSAIAVTASILLLLFVRFVWQTAPNAGSTVSASLPTQATTVEPSPTQTDVPGIASLPISEGQRATPTMTPSPPFIGRGIMDGGFVSIAELNLRRQPNKISEIMTILPARTELDVAGEPRVGDGLRWWPVSSPAGEGWVAEWEPDPHDAEGGYRLIKPSIEPGFKVLVANPLEGGQVRLRQQGCNDPDGSDLRRGTELTIMRGPETGCDVDDPHLVAAGRAWWYVRTPSGEEGWVADFSGDAKAILIAPYWYVESIQPDWYVEFKRQSRTSN